MLSAGAVPDPLDRQPGAGAVGYALDPAKALFVDNTGRTRTRTRRTCSARRKATGTFCTPSRGATRSWRGPMVRVNSTASRRRLRATAFCRTASAPLTQTLPALTFGEADDPFYIDPFSASRAGRFRPRYDYDEARNVFVDRATDAIYRPIDGTFTLVAESASADVIEDLPTTLSPGYYKIIGFDHFERLFTDQRLRGPFVRIFLWTIAHAFLAVVTTFSLGLSFACCSTTSLFGAQSLALADPDPLRHPVIYQHAGLARAAEPESRADQRFLERIVGEGNAPAGTLTMWAKAGILMIQLWLGLPVHDADRTGRLQSIRRYVRGGGVEGRTRAALPQPDAAAAAVAVARC